MGPLEGTKIIELAGIGPGPMAAMLLAEMGATVVRVDRKSSSGLGIPRPDDYNLVMRGRPVIRLDLKDPKGIELVLKMVETSDALIEGFRPGVTERMGLGPEDCAKRNPKLVYGRITGWGQSGPLAMTAGHDPNYIALTGAVHGLGRRDGPPALPYNVLGDYAGGTMYLVMGVLAGIISARRTGRGQVVDAAIVDGAASLLTSLYGLVGAGMVTNRRGDNITDTGAPFYETYECRDGKYVVIAPIEAKFFAILMEKLGLDHRPHLPHTSREKWPALREVLTSAFKARTRDEWVAHFAGSDACLAPVLDWTEAPKDPHLVARGTFTELAGVVQPNVAPRFSGTPTRVPSAPQKASPESTAAVLSHWLAPAEITAARSAGIID